MSINYYSELDGLIQAAIKKDDTEMVSILLDSLFSKMDQQNIELLTAHVDRSMGSFSPKMSEVLRQHLNMSEHAALNYVFSRLDDPDLDRTDLALAVRSLGSNYGVAIASSISAGDDQCIQAIFDCHGEKPISVIFRNGRGAFIDGVEYHRTFEMREVTPDEMLRYLDIAHSIGLLKQHPADSFARIFPFNNSSITYFEFEEITDYPTLPYINDGRVEHPELLLAMMEMSTQHPGAKNLYQRMPALFNKQQDIPLPSTRSFNVVRAWDEYTGDRNARYVERRYRPELYQERALCDLISGYQDTSTDKVSLMESVTNISLGLSCNPKDGEHYHHKDEMLLNMLLPISQRFGFDIDDNHQLAVVNVDDLSLLNMGAVDQANFKRARQAVRSMVTFQTVPAFCGVDNYNALECTKVGVISSSLYSGILVEEMANDPYFKDKILSFLGEDLFLDIASKGWSHYSGKAHAFLQREFNLVCNSRLEIDRAHVIFEMQEEGYRFADDSSIRMGWSLRNDAAVTNSLVAMNYWPDSSVPRPSDVFDGLKALVRKPDNLTLKAHLINHGAEAVCQVAKTEPQWHVVTQLFTDAPEVIARYAPAKFRREVLASSLDL